MGRTTRKLYLERGISCKNWLVMTPPIARWWPMHVFGHYSACMRSVASRSSTNPGHSWLWRGSPVAAECSQRKSPHRQTSEQGHGGTCPQQGQGSATGFSAGSGIQGRSRPLYPERDYPARQRRRTSRRSCQAADRDSQPCGPACRPSIPRQGTHRRSSGAGLAALRSRGGIR